jgi:hypothetical protein
MQQHNGPPHPCRAVLPQIQGRKILAAANKLSCRLVIISRVALTWKQGESARSLKRG